MTVSPEIWIRRAVIGLSLTVIAASAYAAETPGPVAPVIADRLQMLPPGSVRLGGFLEERIRTQAEAAFDAETLAAMADVFRRRPNGFADGEFWGKAVRALSDHYRYNADPRLKALLDATLADLISTQTADGCISGYVSAKQPYNTDMWDRKYVLLGLINGYEATGDPKVLQAAIHMADHLVSQVGPPPKVRIIDTAYITRPPQQPGGWQGMESSSILEPMVRLHRLTGKPQYLEFARYIVEVEGGAKRGSIFEAALAGKDVRDFGGDGIPAHRIAHAYTIISCFEGLLEYHRDTGNDRWKRSALCVYANALAKETTVIGAQSGLGPCEGLAAPEQFSHTGLYQACPVQAGQEGCTHARWMIFCRQLLTLTGDPRFADQFERTMYNALLGSIRPDGKVVDYHTRLNGARPGNTGYRKMFNGRVITCCYYNVTDTLALIPTVAVMQSEAWPVVNLYIPGTARMKLSDGNELTIEQTTDYPRSGEVGLLIRPRRPARFPIRLRIPAWSVRTRVQVNGANQEAKPGTYLSIDRTWTSGDKISLTLDMRCRLVHPPEGCPESAHDFQALVRGPLVLARDKRLGADVEEGEDIQTDADGCVSLVPMAATVGALVQFAVPTSKGGRFPVIDFASSGNTWDARSERVTWIPRFGKVTLPRPERLPGH